MLDPVLSNPWVRAVGVLSGLVFVGLILYLLSPILVPLFFAFTVAYILDPVIDAFERAKISRSVSIACVVMVFAGAALAVPLFLIPGIIRQANALAIAAVSTGKDDSGVTGWVIERIPFDRILEVFRGEQAVDTVSDIEDLETAPVAAGLGADEPAEDALTTYVGAPVETDAADSAGRAPPVTQREALGQIMVMVADRVKQTAMQYFQSHGSEIASAAGNRAGAFLGSVGRAGLNALLLFANIALFGFVSVYLLYDYDRIVAAAKDLVPPRFRPKTFEIAGKIDLQLRSFMRGQLTVCLFLGVMYMTGLSISGVPFGLLIGLFGGIASFVPYLGIALTIGPAVLLCIGMHGVDWHLVGVIATFGVAQLLEGTVVTPKIMGDSIGLGPVWVILAILVFGSALGFLGLLLAVPTAAALKVFVLEGLARYKASAVYKGS